MRATINKTLLKNLPTGRDFDVRDDRLRGFVLRVRKSGAMTYRVTYARGKWVTLGRAEHMTPAEARAKAAVLLGDVANGRDLEGEARRRKASTLRAYVRDVYGPWAIANRKTGGATLERLQACFDADLGGKRLPEITPWHVEKWRTKRLKAGRAVSTINRDITALRAALNRAVEWGIIDANPIARVKLGKLDAKGVVRFLSDDEEAQLRHALANREEQARAERDNANKWRRVRGYPPLPDLRAVTYADHIQPLVMLALNTGMRRGELFNLTWGDVDTERALLTVRGEGAKSGQTRHIPLNAEALDVLRAWRTSSAAPIGPGVYVFPAVDGGRLTGLKTAWRGLLRQAGITRFRFHDLRHTFASKLVMRGVDLNTVRELMGHGDLTMTLRYAHLAPEHKAQAVALLEAPQPGQNVVPLRR